MDSPVKSVGFRVFILIRDKSRDKFCSFTFMTLKFFLGRVKTDGTAPLRIRLKHGNKDTKITCPGLFVRPKDWDKIKLESTLIKLRSDIAIGRLV